MIENRAVSDQTEYDFWLELFLQFILLSVDPMSISWWVNVVMVFFSSVSTLEHELETQKTIVALNENIALY